MDNMEIRLIGLAVWNAIVFLVYAYDKSSAAKRRWRIPESTLILLALAGGGMGAFLGMYMIRHKTRHLKFKLVVPLALVIQMAVLFWAFAC
jgi:uncharacterized membrane protein YsdA (DUF1294 family)